MKYIDKLIERRPNLLCNKKDIENMYMVLFECFKNGNKLLICGNGGSAADSGHIVGELMKSFVKKRELNENIKENIKKIISNNKIEVQYESIVDNLESGLKAIDLTAFNALNTAYINDREPQYVFANSTLNLGEEGDILLCITTSGNSKNIINASIVAKAKNMKVISLTGRDGGIIKKLSDISVVIKEQDTYLIQEEHIAIYHALCMQLEDDLF